MVKDLMSKIADIVRIYVIQFKLQYVLKLLSFKLFQKLLNPYSISSYSQTGEDRIIQSLLGNNLEGFYVDVGCNHPRLYSNTFSLYTRGWKGLNIDANKELICLYKDLRPKDISVCALVSNKEQELTFTEFNDSAVSSVNNIHVAEWETRSNIVNQTKIKAVPLNKILSEYAIPKKFDLLSIDVEGHDYEVLLSLDLNIYRPKLIVIEIHEMDLLKIYNNKIFNYLHEQEYTMVGYIVWNGYFQDNRK